jgi:hypothetical protein
MHCPANIPAGRLAPGFRLLLVASSAVLSPLAHAQAAPQLPAIAQAAAQAKGVKFLRMQNGAAVHEIASGNYQFEVP